MGNADSKESGKPNYGTTKGTRSLDNSFSQTASSARFTGPPDGYKYSTINFYKYDSYSGDEQYLYDSAANLNIDNFGSSIVVTGCDAWTIYQYDNYGGNSLCLYPSDTTNCYPSF